MRRCLLLIIAILFAFYNEYANAQTTDEIAEEGARNLIEIRKHLMDVNLAIEQCASYTVDYDLGLTTELIKLQPCVNFTKVLEQALSNVTESGVIDTILYGD